MENEIFIVIIAFIFYGLQAWGFKALPDERWQIMATIPLRKIDSDRWDGLNLTYYGVFSAHAYLVSVAMMVVLFGSIGVDVKTTFVFIVVMLALCLPMARIVAIVVEKKAHTRTVGGAVFVGTMLAPLAIVAVNNVMGAVESIPMIPAMGRGAWTARMHKLRLLLWKGAFRMFSPGAEIVSSTQLYFFRQDQKDSL